MTRRVLASLVAGLVGVAVLIAADDPVADPSAPQGNLDPEPPVRLKKKARPAGDPAKEDPPAGKAAEPKDRPPEPRPLPEEKRRIDDEPPEPPVPEVDEQELLSRVARNMRTSEDRLANKELGEGTRQLQRDILDDLDKLISKLNQPPPPNGGGSSSASSSSSKQRGQQQAGSGRRSSQKQTAQGQGQPRAGQGNPSPNNMAGQGAGSTPGAGNGSPEGPNHIADVYKDIWGHLPETLRAEMNAYSRQEYMTKYADIIKQYYSIVAEKGRKKGD